MARDHEPEKTVPNIEDLPQLITVQQFADISGLSRTTVYKLIRMGEIKGRHLGYNIRINRDSARDYLGL